jgi:hypothetical protein
MIENWHKRKKKNIKNNEKIYKQWFSCKLKNFIISKIELMHSYWNLLQTIINQHR